MAIKRIDLSGPVKRWKEARKGKEVRAANVEAFEQIQTVVNDSIDGVNQAAVDAQAAVQTANNAVNRANQTMNYADNILDDATAQANRSSSSAKDSQSWAVGGTGTRTGEDSNNSRFYSLESKSEADRAKKAADKAEHYAGFIVPDFIIDFATGDLRYTDTNDIVFVINTTNGTLDYDLM